MTRTKGSETQLNIENNRGIKIHGNNAIISIELLKKLFAIVLIIIISSIRIEYFADSDPSIYFEAILAIISVIFN